MLTKRKIKHSVLNAKHHENEAYVVAQAGRKGAITVSTNMAGRGTDIILGGNPEMIAKNTFRDENRIPEAEPEAFAQLVKDLEASCAKEREEVREAGGLHILGTERHESRRIDNQLRGRAGRQGDPGSSRFYLSLEDDLMRIFAGDKVKNLMERLGMPDGEPIEHPWVTKSVQNAQQKVEERNFDSRKSLLDYDDVMSAQRKSVYSIRQQLLAGRYETDELDEDGRVTGEQKKFKANKDIKAAVKPMVTELLGMFCDPPVMPRDEDEKLRSPVKKDFEGERTLVQLEQLQKEVYQYFGIKIEIDDREDDVIGMYEELVSAVPIALTEQRERLLDLLDSVIGAMVMELCPTNQPPEDWDWQKLYEGFQDLFGVLPEGVDELGDQSAVVEFLYKIAEKEYLSREKEMGYELSLRVFRHVYLEEIDKAWVDHLTNMDHLRDGIGLRGYGQKDPKNEYKKEGYNLFVNMLAAVSSQVVKKVMRVQVQRSEEEEAAIEQQAMERREEQLAHAFAVHGQDVEPALAGGDMPEEEVPMPVHREEPRIASEDECPCGSGKPFSTCHGAPMDDAL
jgi:preprotein translocase subunit SecA